MMNDFQIRFQAEWESQQAVLLTLPDAATDWAYMLPEVIECYKEILKVLTAYGVRVLLVTRNHATAVTELGEEILTGVTVVEAEYNDTWIRDYGPLSLQLSESATRNKPLLADFGFNGWGLKFASNLDNLVTYKLFGHDSNRNPSPRYLNCRGFELEGGSVETDGKGTLLTTSRCLCSPNRNGGLTKAQIEKRLTPILGIKHYLWLDHGYLAGDDTDSHIDTLARLCPHDTIIYVGPPSENDEHFAELSAMREELKAFRTPDDRPYSLVELPFPTPVYDKEDGHRLPATYANYLVTDNVVIVPAYGRPYEDELAAKIIHSIYSDRAVASVDCRALIRQHGSLHCATMQISK